MHPTGVPVQLDQKSLIVVILDGRLIGYVQATRAAGLAAKLRELKVLGKDNVGTGGGGGGDMRGVGGCRYWGGGI